MPTANGIFPVCRRKNGCGYVCECVCVHLFIMLYFSLKSLSKLKLINCNIIYPPLNKIERTTILYASSPFKLYSSLQPLHTHTLNFLKHLLLSTLNFKKRQLSQSLSLFLSESIYETLYMFNLNPINRLSFTISSANL